MQLLFLLISATISFFATQQLVPFFIRLAKWQRCLDAPDGKIKLHTHATPYFGGLAVYAGFMIGLAIMIPVRNDLLFFIIGATVLLLVGLIDDVVVMTPRQKLFGQLCAILCFFKAGFYLKTSFFYALWPVPVALFWLLLVINAINLVDVMDGLATTLSACAAATYLAIALCFGQQVIATLMAIFLGSLLGFLWHNKPVATIYLGDAGSLFIGGILAVTPFFLDWGAFNAHGYAVPVVVLAIPLLEVASLVVIRTYKGIPFYLGSPHHFCMYLKKSGWSVADILWYVASLSVFSGVVATLFAINMVSVIQIVLLSVAFLTVWFFVLFS